MYWDRCPPVWACRCCPQPKKLAKLGVVEGWRVAGAEATVVSGAGAATEAEATAAALMEEVDAAEA